MLDGRLLDNVTLKMMAVARLGWAIWGMLTQEMMFVAALAMRGDAGHSYI